MFTRHLEVNAKADTSTQIIQTKVCYHKTTFTGEKKAEKVAVITVHIFRAKTTFLVRDFIQGRYRIT